MHLLPPFLRKYGIIPESYKIAMTYEEQLLWLCKHLEDIENEFEDFKETVSDLEETVNSFDERIDNNVDSILDLQANLNNLGNVVPITLLSPNLVITDENVDLEEGYYYTGNCQVVSSNELPNTVYIDTNTYFYFNPTGGAGFTPIFRVLMDKDEPSAFLYNVEYSSNTWNRVLYSVVGTIPTNPVAGTVPTVGAVKNYVDSHSGDSVVKTLTDDNLTLNAGIYEPYEGVYYTGNYVINHINNDPLTMQEFPYITLVPENTLCTLDYATQTITILDYPDLPDTIKRTYTFDSTSQAYNKWFLNQVTLDSIKSDLVSTLSSDLILSASSPATPLNSGFYNTGDYKIYLASQSPANELYGNEIVYYDMYTNTFVGSFKTVYWDSTNSTWLLTENNAVENTLSNSRSKIPTSQAVKNYVDSQSGGSGVITPLTQNVTLSDSTTPFSEGLYYSENYVVINTDSSTMVGTSTLFYYNATSNEILTLYEKEFNNKLGEKVWFYISATNKWGSTQYKVLPLVSSGSASDEIPTAKAVYEATLHTYSTTEQRVGTWTDGKPVYERTIIDDNLTLSNGFATFSTTIANVENVCSSEGYVGSINTAGWRQGYLNNNYYSGLQCSVNENNVLSMTIYAKEASNTIKSKVIVRYTKTTD